MFYYILEFVNQDWTISVEEISSTFDIIEILKNKYPHINILINS